MKLTRILKKTVKWAGFIISGLLALLLVLFLVAFIATEKRMNKDYSAGVIKIEIPSDSLSIQRGAHLYSVHACAECHASDLGGKVMEDNLMIGRFTGSNLTHGKGGIPVDFTDQDWLKALKLGIGKDGHPLTGMPSNEFSQMPDKDLADIITYCKNHEPVDRVNGKLVIGPMIRILTAVGKVKLFAAEEINQDVVYIEKPATEATAEYGATLAINCLGCHGTQLKGGPSPIPGMPVVPDISSSGRIGKWTEKQFMNTLRTGTTPDGHQFKNEEMPWIRFKQFSDLELKALRAYLLKAKEVPSL
jgi:mono/diheme cytochrome c family protein